MTLPNRFLFNQSNLQDYVDCQRRFQLRHILHLAWPAVEAEPVHDYECIIDQGLQFHKIIRQYLIGVPESHIERMIVNDHIMEAWWRNFRYSSEQGILKSIFQEENMHFEEITLSMPLGEFRLIAKVDLLVQRKDGKLIILDWKTSQKHPKRKWLADRLQTQVYPFVTAHAVPGIIGGGAVAPEQLEMVYWFVNQPEEPEVFSYNRLAYQRDLNYFDDLINTISKKSEPVFPLTSDVKRCLFCTYRSLCERGEKPGMIHQLEDMQEDDFSSQDVSLDYEQIGEIKY